MISTARVIDTPEDKSEDGRAVRAVFNSFVKLPTTGVWVTKSMYFAINLARKQVSPATSPIMMASQPGDLKKLPRKIRTRVETGKATPSS